MMTQTALKCGPAMKKMLAAFPHAEEKSNHWWANDDSPRFDFQEQENGSIKINPWTHHTRPEILAMGGLTEKDISSNGYTAIKIFSKIDLLTLAQAKRIHWKELEAYGLRDEYKYKGYNCVKIPYYWPDGTQHTKIKVRKEITGSFKHCWDEGTPGEIIPYGLDKLQIGVAAGYLLIGEGETDAWACWHHTIPYLGLPGATQQKALKGINFNNIPVIYIISEPDQFASMLSKGESFYKFVHNRLRAEGYTGQIYCINFKQATGYKDPSDLHVGLFNSQQEDQFTTIIDQAKQQAIPANDHMGGSGKSTIYIPPPVAQPDEPYNLTDLGNAERFALRYKDNVRWCEIWKSWMFFNGKCWEQDKIGRVDQLAKIIVRSIYAEAAKMEDEKMRPKLAKHAAASESNRAVRAMLDRAKSELPATPEDFNKQLYLLNCANGTLDLQTGELRPHSPHDMLTRCIKIAYNPLAWSTRWKDFVTTILGGNADLISFMQQALGMSLCGDTSEQCLFICHGMGSNGKTTMLETVRLILASYACAANIETFQMRKTETIGNDVAELYGARLVTASETKLGGRLNEAFVKKATGKEPLRARRLHENEFEFMPEFTLWLAVNHKPVVLDTSKGMWRRVRFVPFNVTFEENQIDPQFGNKLLEEAEGILAWLVQGCREWVTQGRLTVPQVVKEATEGYRAEMDIVANFLKDECILKKGAKVSTKQLIERFESWCGHNSEKFDAKILKNSLKERGLHSQRGTGGSYYWQDIGLIAGPGPEKDEIWGEGSEGSKNILSSDSERSEGSERKNRVNQELKNPPDATPNSRSLPSLRSLSELKTNLARSLSTDSEIVQGTDEAENLSTPFSKAYLSQLMTDLIAYLRRQPLQQVIWVGPGTGIANGSVSKQKYIEQIKECWRSGDEKRVRAAVNAILKKLGREEEIA